MNKNDLFIWGILIGIVLCYFLIHKIKQIRIKKILRTAKAGEKRAIRLLEQHGYRVVALQIREKVITEISGTAHENTIIADMIVRKGFFKYVVEVKTQGQAFPTLPNVRRQMMEYYLVFKPHGVIFLDMEKEKLRMVKFKCAYHKQNIYKRSIICFILGMLTAVAYSKFLV